MKRLRTSLSLVLLLVSLLVPVCAFTLESQVSVEQVNSLLSQLNSNEIRSKISDEQLNSYRAILVELNSQLNQPTEEQQNSNNSSEELQNLLSDQLNGLIELQSELEQLSTDNAELTNSLQTSLQTIRDLRNSLEVALDRLGDAEIGALSLLDQNTELYNQNRQMEDLTNSLRKEMAKMEKRAALQPYVWFGGAGIAATGGYFMIDGFANNNPRNTITGAAIIGTDVLVYVLGRWVFCWW
jgi:DNA repair exonuclease SbcCD ATPase subunit